MQFCLLKLYFTIENCLLLSGILLNFSWWEWGLNTEKVILEAVILTAVVVIALTLYTFWAASRGYDFNFLGPFLFGAILVLMVFGMIQVLWFLNFNVLFHPLIFWLHSQCVFLPADFLSIGQVIYNDLWLLGSNYILRLHPIWYRQLDQEILLWWIHLGFCLLIFGHHQPFPVFADYFQSCW